VNERLRDLNQCTKERRVVQKRFLGLPSFFKPTPQRLFLFLSLERDVGMVDRVQKLAVGPQQAARTSKVRKMKNKRKIDEECTDNEYV
jgi:hypothetical protein